ncbi:MAG: ABC transporter permease/substrate-binding protein [bacterium]|nr:ABC transporter permease/substrate-binding protein [bacterium]
MSFVNYFENNFSEILDQTIEHFQLTIVALFIATLVGSLIGIFIARHQKLANPILSVVNIIQTIPSLALLGFFIPILGIGAVPAIVALFLYALLPIVRNTYTGILQVDPAIKEAAIGLGMTKSQQLIQVELPLSGPVILAGIRTASVINVGIATICALIAAGGLGESIFGGISLNNVNMILSGAIPASLMALAFDGLLGIVQKVSQKKPAVPLIAVVSIFVLSIISVWPDTKTDKLVAGFNSEFIQREDGFVGLDKLYGLPLEIREMEIGLMYEALRIGEVDVIDGFSTDGRIKAFDLKLLKDDKGYFPPYFAAPLFRQETLDKYPQLENALTKLESIISNQKMAELNSEIDQSHKDPQLVAQEFLNSIGVKANFIEDDDNPDIIIGSKAFTENYLLAYIIGQLIEAETSLKVSLKLGFGGTKLLFDALNTGEIDCYPEYTGTGLLVILQPENEGIKEILHNRNEVYKYVKSEFQSRYGIKWLPEFGFNNTFALMMRREHAEKLEIESISQLSQTLNK